MALSKPQILQSHAILNTSYLLLLLGLKKGNKFLH